MYVDWCWIYNTYAQTNSLWGWQVHKQISQESQPMLDWQWTNLWQFAFVAREIRRQLQNYAIWKKEKRIMKIKDYYSLLFKNLRISNKSHTKHHKIGDTIDYWYCGRMSIKKPKWHAISFIEHVWYLRGL